MLRLLCLRRNSFSFLASLPSSIHSFLNLSHNNYFELLLEGLRFLSQFYSVWQSVLCLNYSETLFSNVNISHKLVKCERKGSKFRTNILSIILKYPSVCIGNKRDLPGALDEHGLIEKMNLNAIQVSKGPQRCGRNITHLLLIFCSFYWQKLFCLCGLMCDIIIAHTFYVV